MTGALNTLFIEAMADDGVLNVNGEGNVFKGVCAKTTLSHGGANKFVACDAPR